MLQQFQQFKKMLGTQDPQQLLNELEKEVATLKEQVKDLSERIKGMLEK